MSSISPIIKVCGMRDAENIREVESLGIDLMGFICWEHSPRYVSEIPSYLPKCQRVGVFVNPTIDYVLERSKKFCFNYIQLHGNESPEICQAIKEETGLKIIKAISIGSPPSNTEKFNGQFSLFNDKYEGCADLFLFDTKCKCVGGSGEQFNWDVLLHYKGDTPFLLSGGIGPNDAERLTHWHHPKCIGIDINSRFETSPGIKDAKAISKFVRERNKW